MASHPVWIRALRALAFVALLCNSSTTSSADEAVVRAPYVERGDCWSYRAENIQHQGKPIRDYELCVNLVDPSKDRIFAVATVKDDGREIDMVYSTEWATYASVTGMISRQGVRPYRFPMKVGDAYSMEFDFLNPRLGTNAGTVRNEVKVAGWEDIAVPAGTFRALRIEMKGRTKRTDQISEFDQSTTIWYSPQVRRHVKFQNRNPWQTQGEELTSFRLNQ